MYPRIEKKTEENRLNSVSHFILMQKCLKKLAKIQIPESGHYKKEALLEELESRILEMNYSRLSELIKTQTDAEFIKTVKTDKTKNVN